jgi:TolB-like protein
MADVFISYSRQDRKTAERFAAAFEASGYSVWWDAALLSGETFDEVIEAALREAKAVVVLWSPHSVASRWVRAEAALAQRLNTLVPVTIARCDKPLVFAPLHTRDLSHWDGSSADLGWLAFQDDLRRLMADGQTVATRDAPAAAPAADPPLPDKPSIAVMPFANLSQDPDQAYFVDGLMEEIIGALTRFTTFFVIASGTSLSLRGQDLTPLEAALRLGVRYMLEGSVRRAGDQVRIAVKLIDSHTGAQIWAHRFDGKLEDVFALQDEVALGVAGVMEFKVEHAETLRSIKRPTSDLRSYELYLLALARLRTYTREGVYDALRLLEKALELDPDYGRALGLAASCHVIILQYHWTDDPAEHARLMMERVDKAVHLAWDSPQLLGTASLVYRVAGDYGTAAKLAERSASLNPGSAFSLLAKGWACGGLGRFEEAEDCLKRALRLDPISPDRNLQLSALAETYLAQGRFGEAADIAHEAIQLTKAPTAFALAASANGHLANYPAAAEALASMRAMAAISPEEVAALMYQKPEHRAVFLEGIARAEKGTAAVPSS